MHRILVWSTLWLLLITSQAVHTQSPTDAWPIVEHCVSNATKPPADWHFDGTLLLSSFSRLHTYQQGWDTPRIQVFYSFDIPSSGQLSPDGKWFATIEGKRERVQVVTAWKTSKITIHSTDSKKKYTIPWENIFFASHSLNGHKLYWLDNQHLLYSKDDKELNEKWFVINPFTQEVKPWQNKFKPSTFAVAFSSDRSKALHYEQWDEYWTLADDEHEIKIPILGNVAWSSDSSRFVAYTMKPDTRDVADIALFDSEGNLIDHIFHIPDANEVFWDVWTANQMWSPNDQYILFAADHLYLADMNQKTVIDTCISTRSLTIAWSPSSTQIAIIESYDPKREVQIFDLDRWARYIVAYHSGSVIGWRTDD